MILNKYFLNLHSLSKLEIVATTSLQSISHCGRVRHCFKWRCAQQSAERLALHLLGKQPRSQARDKWHSLTSLLCSLLRPPSFSRPIEFLHNLAWAPKSPSRGQGGLGMECSSDILPANGTSWGPKARLKSSRPCSGICLGRNEHGLWGFSEVAPEPAVSLHLT